MIAPAPGIDDVLQASLAGVMPEGRGALALADASDLEALLDVAGRLRDQAHGTTLTYSPKIFVPLTRLCRDSCHYCTFATRPSPTEPVFMSPDEVIELAKAGRRAGCHEALFTLGERPELRWPQARKALDALGFPSTLAYLAHVARRVVDETGLLPHLNPGTLDAAELALLRPVAASMGLMLETSAQRLAQRGGPHFGSPDKAPAVRLATIEAAGMAAVPFTTGILVGIGETRRERIESLLAIRDLQRRFGHIQEVIVQNFLPKAGTRMAAHSRADRGEHLWSVAIARIILGPDANLQAPPNLAPAYREDLIRAGINDWGGISPVTADFVNPEAPWPEIEQLSEECARVGRILVPRLTAYPDYVRRPERWFDPAMRPHVLKVSDADGLARETEWLAGAGTPARPLHVPRSGSVDGAIARILDLARTGEELSASQVESLFAARGGSFQAVCAAADELRRESSGEVVGYVVNRNINYTNICSYRCAFCAFSKGKTSDNLRGKPYRLDLAEFRRRVAEAWERGATEVCLQGGIHPDYTGRTYLEFVAAAKQAAPAIHVHAFSPLEIWQGARSMGWSLETFLRALKSEGLGSLPGTAAEILDDEVRAEICPDKLTAGQWFEVMASAHEVGLKSTSTIMFGHVERSAHWARHLVGIRNHQRRYGGFTEFVPLPFVAHQTPIFLKGRSRRGPTLREAVLMHAVARIVLHPFIPNIQASWVKMGRDGVRLALDAGANDMGGTLMNESITRAAGAVHGQEFAPAAMASLILGIGRIPRQRTTLYGFAPEDRVTASFKAATLREPCSVEIEIRH